MRGLRRPDRSGRWAKVLCPTASLRHGSVNWVVDLLLKSPGKGFHQHQQARIGKVVDDQTDKPGPSIGQPRGRAIWAVAQFPCFGFDPRPHFLGHRCPRVKLRDTAALYNPARSATSMRGTAQGPLGWPNQGSAVSDMPVPS